MADNRAGDLEAVRVLMERMRTVQLGGAPRFVIAVDETGFHIRETISVNHVAPNSTVSGRAEIHYQTYPIASGSSLSEAVRNVRAIRWSSIRE